MPTDYKSLRRQSGIRGKSPSAQATKSSRQSSPSGLITSSSSSGASEVGPTPTSTPNPTATVSAGTIRDFEGGMANPSTRGATSVSESCGPAEADRQVTNHSEWVPEAVGFGQQGTGIVHSESTTPSQLRRSARKSTPLRKEGFEYTLDGNVNNNSHASTFLPCGPGGGPMRNYRRWRLQ